MNLHSYILRSITYSLLLCHVVVGFQAALRCPQASSKLWSERGTPDGQPTNVVRTTKPKTPAEILAEQEAKGTQAPAMPLETPILFSEELCEDMTTMLRALEQRAKEGPGSLSLEDVANFEASGKRIQAEMLEFDRTGGTTVAAAAPVTEVAVSPGAPFEVQPTETKAPTTPPPPPQQQEHQFQAPQAVNGVTDTSDDEAPEYDGSGSMGLAKGTANTYAIPGMDAMSPEEYQKAIQQSIIDRQTARKKSGNYGNRQTWDYLNQLTGESGVLKKRKDKEDEEKP